MLKALGEGSIKEPGYLLFTVTRQVGRPNHFTVEEGWASHLAFDAHEAAEPTRQFRDKISRCWVRFTISASIRVWNDGRRINGRASVAMQRIRYNEDPIMGVTYQ